MTADRDGPLGTALDVFRVKQYFDGITLARQLAAALAADAELLRGLSRGLLPGLPGGRRRRRPNPFAGTAASHVHVPWRDVAVVATGGSGAMAALLGVLRACEECRVTPQVLSFASGAALFGFPVAAGRPAAAVADFVLSLEPADYIDVDWKGLASLVPTLGRGFAGIVKGDRLEARYRDFLGDMRLGDLKIPAYAPLWNVERNLVEYIGPRTYPDLTVARAVRLAVSLPLFLDPQPLEGGFWGDGGLVDILPVRPVLDLEPPPDAALVLNCFYPPGFEGEDATGWRDRRLSILHAATQVRTAQQAQLARENLARLRSEVREVLLIEPIPYTLVKGGRFYLQFVDTSMWPEFMRAGRRDTLAAFRHAARAYPRSRAA